MISVLWARASSGRAWFLAVGEQVAPKDDGSTRKTDAIGGSFCATGGARVVGAAADLI